MHTIVWLIRLFPETTICLLPGCHLQEYFRMVSLKFIYSEKATKFWEIFTLILTVCTVVKSKVKIWQNFVANSEYMYELYNGHILIYF